LRFVSVVVFVVVVWGFDEELGGAKKGGWEVRRCRGEGVLE
jgi:hypothetical protein